VTIPAPPGPLPRRSQRPFPRRRHLPAPGTPHPATEGFIAVADDAWARDLFDHRFYWEAHEAWETAWAALPRASPQARFYQGLICAAAFVVKQHQGVPAGAGRLLERARDHLDVAAQALGPTPHGIDTNALLQRLVAFRNNGAWPTLPDHGDG